MQKFKKELIIDRTDWISVKFGDVVFEPKESCKDPEAAGIEHVVGLEHIETENIHLRSSSTLEEPTTFTKRFEVGDMLFGRRRAYLKKAALASFNGICSGDITVFRSKENLLVELLPFLVSSESFFDYAIKHSAGGLSPRVKFKDLANFEFLLPPKDQQAQLAKLLWAMDDVIETSLNFAKQVLCSKFQILENKIVDLAANDKTGSTFKELGKWVSGGTPSKKVKEYWQNGNVLWVTPKDMKGTCVGNSLDKLTVDAITLGKAKMFKRGSTVLVWRSGILKHTLPIARITADFTINQDLKVFQPSGTSYLESFVRIYLTVFSEKIRRDCVKSGTTVESLDTASFLKFKIPWLKKSDQEIVVKEERAFNKAVNEANELLKHSKALQKSLINQIF